MTAKEVAEYLTTKCDPETIVLIDIEGSPLYEEVFEIGELSPAQRNFLNAHHADNKAFVVFHNAAARYFKGDQDD